MNSLIFGPVLVIDSLLVFHLRFQISYDFSHSGGRKAISLATLQADRLGHKLRGRLAVKVQKGGKLILVVMDLYETRSSQEFLMNSATNFCLICSTKFLSQKQILFLLISVFTFFLQNQDFIVFTCVTLFHRQISDCS